MSQIPKQPSGRKPTQGVRKQEAPAVVEPFRKPVVETSAAPDATPADDARWLIPIVAVSLVVGTTLIAGIGWMLIGRSRPQNSDSLATSSAAPARILPPRQKDEERPAELAIKKTEQPAIKSADIKPMKVAVAPTPKSTGVAKVDPTLGKPLSPTFSDIEAKRRLLSLPNKEGGVATSLQESLCKVFVNDSADCELKLHTTEHIADGQPRLLLRRDEKSADGSSFWTVLSQVPDPFIEGTLKQAPIGQFVLNNTDLSFRWNDTTPVWSYPHGLTFCKLDVTVGDQTVQCSLFKAESRKPEKLNLSERRQSLDLQVPPGSLANVDALHVTLELHVDGSQYSTTISATEKHPVTLEIPHRLDVGEGKVALDFRFDPPASDSPAKLEYSVYPFMTFLNEVKATKPMELPSWERLTIRCDKLKPMPNQPPALKEGFILSDLARLQKFGFGQKNLFDSQITKTLNPQIKEIEADIRAVQRELKDANDSLQSARDRKDLNGIAKAQGNIAQTEQVLARLNTTLAYQEGLRQHALTGAKHHDDFQLWLEAMKRRFTDLQSNAEVRYSVFLTFGDERIVLSETNPPPQSPETKTKEVATSLSEF